MNDALSKKEFHKYTFYSCMSENIVIETFNENNMFAVLRDWDAKKEKKVVELLGKLGVKIVSRDLRTKISSIITCEQIQKMMIDDLDGFYNDLYPKKLKALKILLEDENFSKEIIENSFDYHCCVARKVAHKTLLENQKK